MQVPAARPLIIIQVKGSFPETFLLILLSSAQKVQASKTPNAPTEKDRASPGSYDKIRQDEVITVIAAQIRLPTASLNKKAAIRPVATDSKFNRSEPVAAGVIFMEYMRVTGARIPPKKDIPARYGISCLVTGESEGASPPLAIKPAMIKRSMPSPLPI
ncbi:MAG: hypothetical protein BWY45_03520 [Euryarchaeota archaeon ADurb.Bin294]|nr:MAG: hypothetical protein BWY45_03520 [Euryarchaeota archaeon ADurb.Bin294]